MQWKRYICLSGNYIDGLVQEIPNSIAPNSIAMA